MGKGKKRPTLKRNLLAHSDFSSVRYTSRLWRHWCSCLYIANES